MASAGKYRRTGGIKAALAELKYPLVFFGLALAVVESAFGVTLGKGNHSELLNIIITSWMGVLFLITIISVVFLVYTVPTHIMLRAQKEPQRDISELKQMKKRLKSAVQNTQEILEKTSIDSDELEVSLREITTILEEIA